MRLLAGTLRPDHGTRPHLSATNIAPRGDDRRRYGSSSADRSWVKPTVDTVTGEYGGSFLLFGETGFLSFVIPCRRTKTNTSTQLNSKYSSCPGVDSSLYPYATKQCTHTGDPCCIHSRLHGCRRTAVFALSQGNFFARSTTAGSPLEPYVRLLSPISTLFYVESMNVSP